MEKSAGFEHDGPTGLVEFHGERPQPVATAA
jgi:hypothetical protein